VVILLDLVVLIYMKETNGFVGYVGKLLTVHEDLFIDVEDGDFRIVEE